MENINGWNKTLEKLLVNWSQQISINESVCIKRGYKLKVYYYCFGVFIIIAQTGALTTLINAIATGNNGNILIVVAILETLSLIAQGIDTFFDFSSASKVYYNSSREFNSLSRFIDSTLAIPRKDRELARELVLSIRKQFNDINTTCPQLPLNKIIHKLDMSIYENPHEAVGIKNNIENINVDYTKGILYVEDKTPPKVTVEIKNEKVELPENSPEKKQLVITFDDILQSDEEIISNSTENKVREQLQLKKSIKKREEFDKKNPISKILEYQWRRFEQHNDDINNENVKCV